MREEFDGKLLELSYKNDNEITLAMDDIWEWHISQLQSVFEEIEEYLRTCWWYTKDTDSHDPAVLAFEVATKCLEDALKFYRKKYLGKEEK